MGGFKREQAREALALGWEQQELLGIHNRLGENSAIKTIYDWGIVDCFGAIWYKGVAPEATAYRIKDIYFNSQAVAYTDGSGTRAEKPAGIGVFITDGSFRYFISENIGLGTNNRAELAAIWRAIRQYPNFDKRVLIRSDSEYAIGSLTQDWHANVNTDLIRRIREDLAERQFRIEFEHVEGHSKTEGNEIADRLASVGRKLVTTVTDYGT